MGPRVLINGIWYKITTLGTLTVASVVPDSEATERALMFLPALLPVGIEPADPMIQFRNKTYPVSYDRRHQSQPVRGDVPVGDTTPYARRSK